MWLLTSIYDNEVKSYDDDDENEMFHVYNETMLIMFSDEYIYNNYGQWWTC